MTGRERFLHSILGAPVDRFFRWELGAWPSTIERWRLEGYPADADFNTFFQMDPLARITRYSGYTDSPFYPPLAERTIEETDEYRLCVNSDGITMKVLKQHSDTSMPQFLQFPVASRSDWERMKQHLRPEDAPGRIGDPALLERQCSDPAIPTMLPICGVYGHPRNLFGEEGLAYLLFDDPALLHEILDNWCRLYVALIEHVTAVARVDSLLIWEDMCYKNGPLISPRHFREFMLRPYQEVIRTARAHGIEAIIVDSDGDVRQMLPLFIEAGANAVLPFEVQAGMDVVRISQEFGADFCIIGGIDKRALARDRSSIRREVDRVLPYFVEHGRYIPSLDHTAPADVPFDLYKYYLECVRQYENA